MSGIEEIKHRLGTFKKRYYLRQIVVGSLLFLILSIALFLIVNSIEYQLWLSTTIRFFLFLLSFSTTLFLFFWLIIRPLSLLTRLRKGISDEAAANEISKHFPEIKDKLVNTLQLSQISEKDNLLLQAAINRKAKDFEKLPFIQAVDFSLGKRYGWILASIVLCLILVSFVNPSMIKDGTNRIVHYNQEFSPAAPFEFKVLNKNLNGFRGEDFLLSVEITGEAIPEKVYLKTKNGNNLRLIQSSPSSFEYSFSNIKESVNFQLEASGYYSNPYTITINDRPDLIAMDIHIQSPSYTGEKEKKISNNGNLTVLEGSKVTWNILSKSTDSLQFFLGKVKLENQRTNKDAFEINKRIANSDIYEIYLFNEFGKNSSAINHTIEVIKDEKPKIQVEYFPDTTLFQFVTLAGNIVDDHGFSELSLNYKKEGETTNKIPLELSTNVKEQSFYANWNIDSLQLESGEKLEFFITVSDNDQVNGSKTTRSRSFIVEIPDEKEIKKIVDDKSQLVENQLDKTKKEAEEINERMKEVEEKLKAEQKFGWQEKKQLDDIIEDREKLQKQIEDLQKKHEDLERTNKQLNKRSERINDQNEKLQKLLDELLDEETRELYEQLKELLKQDNPDSDQVRQELQNIQKNEKNLERELDRALELFKRLKMESALEENLETLEKLSKKQEDLAEKNTEGSDQKKIQEEQEEIQSDFEKFREEMSKVEEMNQELKKPQPIENYEMDERIISRDLKEIEEELNNQKSEGEDEANSQKSDNSDDSNQTNESDTKDSQQQEDGSESQESNNQDPNNQESGGDKSEKGEKDDASSKQQGNNKPSQSQTQDKQKGASQKMKQLQQKLSNMQSGMQMEMMQANLDQLRDILDNLVKLSFNQERLMKEMARVNQSDPRFLTLSQEQLKLKDDAKVIQDSLLSLAERVVQLSSFITREVGNINSNIDEALDFLKDRNRNRALASQKFTMTSINNLALLLDDTMQQMQMAMSEAMGNPSQSQQKQNGLPDLQQMQQQLGEKMNGLKNSGKQGRELSEELARLAAEQEMIRRQLQQLKEAEDGMPGGQSGGDELQRAIQQMEQNEIDLVNKRLTQQLINRQKNIETRLLKAEKAQREQEIEEEREAESPSVFSREIPPQFEEYLKLKQKEIELLKTIPIELNPFYKKEVNNYFRRISTDTKND
ncbi:MAG: hypothetical protein AAF551_00605 [Bacteroidota bacterium]